MPTAGDIVDAETEGSLGSHLDSEGEYLLENNGVIDRYHLITTSFDYELFLRRMRHPACKPLLRNIKRLINRFANMRNTSQNFPITAILQVYRSSLDSIIRELVENPVWRLVGEAKPEEYDLAREGVEYLVMNQIHPYVFAASIEDQEHDEQIYRKMMLHSRWLKPEHLDIQKIDEEAIGKAIAELCRVNEYLTPRDKLICLLNACHHIKRSEAKS